MKLMGIDYGEKRVGIAISDDDGAMAFPRSIMSNDNKLVGALASLVTDENIGGIVIGESKDFRGKNNPIMERITALTQALSKKVSVPIHFESEVYSTKEAERGQEHVRDIDASAAAIILQRFIDKQTEHHANH